MFNVGDTVLYGSDGVCRIAEICQKEISGFVAEYYLLRPIYRENSSIFVPLKNENLLSKMKHILSADEILDIINSVVDGEIEWIEDEAERKLYYKRLIANGNRREMLYVIKSLYLKQKERIRMGRKLHITDEIFLRDAERLIYDEFALVLNIKPDEVLPFIMERVNADTEE